jgi:hypothetical protein
MPIIGFLYWDGRRSIRGATVGKACDKNAQFGGSERKMPHK